jgi:PilZ domain
MAWRFGQVLYQWLALMFVRLTTGQANGSRAETLLFSPGGTMIRRKHPRFLVELPCSFMGDEATGEGTVLDLSMEGCCMRSTTPLLKGTYVNVFLTLLGQIPPLPIELAVIRWAKGHMFGLEFIRIADTHLIRLRRYTENLEQVPGQ